MNKTTEIKRRLSFQTTHIVFITLLGLLLIARALSPGFFAQGNISNILRQCAFLGLVAVGQTFVIITAGTDLSVSYLVTMGNLIGAQLMASSNANIPQALFSVIAIGAVVGIINGAGVHYLKIPSLLMTLGVGTVLQGIYYLYTKGAPKGNTAPLINSIVTNRIIGPITQLILIWIIVSIVVMLVLHKTTFGRNVYAIGENAKAAKYAGVPVGRTTILVYMISGIFACVTGLLLVGYTGTSFLDAGTDYQMDSIAAVVIGGTMLSGGSGGYGGTIGGTMILCVILNILNIIMVPTFGKAILRGSIIIILLIVYGIQKKRK